MSKYRIEAHHLNINIGDATLLLVFQSDDDGNTESLTRVVLIDGGTQEATSRVLNYLTNLNNYFRERANANFQLKIDMIVVSHDDEDHIGGIVGLLKRDAFKAFLKANDDQNLRTYICDQGMPEGYTETYKNFIKLITALEAGKYVVRLTKAYPNNSLYFLRPEKLADLRAGKLTVEEVSDTGNIQYYQASSIEVAISNNQLNRRYGSSRKAKMSAKEATNKYNEIIAGYRNAVQGLKVTVQVAGVNESIYCDKRLLGRDLLWINNTNIGNDPSTAYLAQGGINELRAKQSDIDQAKPALFCVGINGAFIQPPARIVDIVYPDTTTLINQRSLALVLVTPSPQNQVIHYLCGDLGEASEQMVVNWLQSQGNLGQIPVIKLSHHGSKTSTPYKFFETIKPITVIVSAGDQHNHPSITTVIYAYIVNQLNNPKAPWLYSTNYPYYLDVPIINAVKTIEDATNLTDAGKVVINAEIGNEKTGIIRALQETELLYSNLNNFPADVGPYRAQIIQAFKTTIEAFTKQINLANIQPIVIRGGNKTSPANILIICTEASKAVGLMQAFWNIFQPARTEAAPVALGQQAKITAYQYTFGLNDPNFYGDLTKQSIKSITNIDDLKFTNNFNFAGRALAKSSLLNKVNLSIEKNLIDNPWQLASDCSLYAFLSSLSANVASLAAASQDALTKLVTDMLAATLQPYFSTSSINNISVTVKETVKNTVVSIDVKDVAFTATLALTSATNLKLNGLFSANEIIQFSFDSSNPKISLTTALSLRTMNDSSSDISSISTVLSKLTNVSLDQVLLLDPTSYITLDVSDSNYPELETHVICQTPFTVSLPGIDPTVFSVGGTNINSGKRTRFSQASVIFEGFMATFSGNIAILNEPLQVTVLIDDSGMVSVAFTPAVGSLSKLLQSLVGIDPIQALNALPLPLNFDNAIDQIVVNLNVFPLALLQTQLYGNFKISDISVNTCVSFPNFVVNGSLDDSAANNVNFKALADWCGISFLSTLISDLKLDQFTLNSLDFSLDPTNKIWSIASDIGTVGDTCQFGYLKLQDFQFSLEMVSGQDAQVSLGANIDVGEALVSIQGTYTDDDWDLIGYVSAVSVSGLLNLLPVPTDCILTDLLKQLSFTEINVALDYTNKDLSLFCNVVISATTFSVTYDAGQDEEQLLISWAGDQAIDLDDMLKEIGLTALSSAIPDIAIKLTQVDFIYNLTSNVLIIDLDSQYGKAVLVVENTNGNSNKVFILNWDLPATISSLPVVGDIDNPLQKVQLLWLANPLNKEDVSKINSVILSIDDLADVQLPSTADATQTSLAQGASLCFYIVGVNDPFLLSLGGSSKLLAVPEKMPNKKLSSSPISTAWIKVQKTLGPLNLQRIGVGYNSDPDPELWLMLDGGITMGALSVQLEGLGVGVPLKSPQNIAAWDLNLDGLGMTFNGGPTELSGNFLIDKTQTDPNVALRYSGGAIMQMEDLCVSGIGSYAKFTDAYKKATGQDCSVFVFVRVKKPLGGPPFMYVTGVAGGFGYNQHLRVPTQDEVVNFPLVQGSVDPTVLSDDLMTVEETLLHGDDSNAPWIIPTAGEDWLAVGLDFTTFEIVGTRALAVAEFGQDFQLAVLGRSSMQLPKTGTAIAYVEMGLEAVYKPSEGLLSMTALVSPNSYVLTPDCQLTGGFAFYSWFKDQLNGASAGDFVLTVGGYHPSFNPPAWYPQVPRLGFNWPEGNVTISGDAYFALTTSAVMAGGYLQAVYQSGDLQAWLKTGADFLIEWHPFHYEADIGISVGASYRLNLLFTTVTISAEIGADLSLWGPPTGGEVDIDWYIISFSISFGASNADAQPITWKEFRKFLPPVTPTSPSLPLLKGVADDTPVALNRIIVGNGLVQQTSLGDTAKTPCWIVRSDEFCFHTESAFPVTVIQLNGSAIKDASGVDKFDQPIYVKPMGTGALNDSPGILHVTAMDQVTLNEQGVVITSTPIDVSAWTKTIVTRNVPDALWGNPQSALDLDNKLLANYWVGLTVQSPGAQPGPTAGPIPIKKAFSDTPIRNTSLPLLTQFPAEPLPQVNAESLQKIHDTIAVTKDVRNNVVTSLMGLGFFSQLSKTNPMNGLDAMNRLAANPSNFLLEAPLQLTSTNAKR